MIDAGDVAQMPQLRHDIAQLRAAAADQERAVKVYADYAAGGGNGAQLIVREVPGVIGESARVGMGCNHHTVDRFGQRQDVGHGEIRSVRDVDQQAERERATDEHSSTLGQPKRFRRRIARRARQLIGIGVHQADDAQAAARPALERVRIVGERPRAFEREEGAHAVACREAAGLRVKRVVPQRAFHHVVRGFEIPLPGPRWGGISRHEQRQHHPRDTARSHRLLRELALLVREFPALEVELVR